MKSRSTRTIFVFLLVAGVSLFWSSTSHAKTKKSKYPYWNSAFSATYDSQVKVIDIGRTKDHTQIEYKAYDLNLDLDLDEDAYESIVVTQYDGNYPVSMNHGISDRFADWNLEHPPCSEAKELSRSNGYINGHPYTYFTFSGLDDGLPVLYHQGYIVNASNELIGVTLMAPSRFDTEGMWNAFIGSLVIK
jgi:hypothetical protein